MVILDGRSVQARLLALAERVERVRERMKLVGITIRTLTQHSRLAERMKSIGHDRPQTRRRYIEEQLAEQRRLLKEGEVQADPHQPSR